MFINSKCVAIQVNREKYLIAHNAFIVCSKIKQFWKAYLKFDVLIEKGVKGVYIATIPVLYFSSSLKRQLST